MYRAKASHDGRTVALKKVQIFEMMDSKVIIINIKIINNTVISINLSNISNKSGETRLHERDPAVAAA